MNVHIYPSAILYHYVKFLDSLEEIVSNYKLADLNSLSENNQCSVADITFVFDIIKKMVHSLKKRLNFKLDNEVMDMSNINNDSDLMSEPPNSQTHGHILNTKKDHLFMLNFLKTLRLFDPRQYKKKDNERKYNYSDHPLMSSSSIYFKIGHADHSPILKVVPKSKEEIYKIFLKRTVQAIKYFYFFFGQVIYLIALM